MSDRKEELKAELEKKKAKLKAIREEKERRQKEKEQKLVSNRFFIPFARNNNQQYLVRLFTGRRRSFTNHVCRQRPA